MQEDEPVGGLFGPLFARGSAAAEIDDNAWIVAMVQAEAALARTHARLGTIPAAEAEVIDRACVAEHLDPAELARHSTTGGNPVIPLVHRLREILTEWGHGSAASLVHLGATSQDIVDTAMMLVARRACAAIRSELAELTHQLATLAAAHRTTPMVGRTLLQQALPTTFGAVVASWLHGLDSSGHRLEQVASQRLAVQLGGAVGTLSAFDAPGPQMLTVYAAELGLTAPDLPWHTERSRIAELAAALGGIAGSVGTVARDVTLLAQTELGELSEHGDGTTGGSSTMPHKHNPIAAVTALACAQQTPGIVSTLFNTMVQEHQRAAGAWHAEWMPVRELLSRTGSAVTWLRTCVERLRVNESNMRANLDRLGGVLLAERVSADLAGDLGRERAHELVRTACTTVTERPDTDLVAELHTRVEGIRSRDHLARLLDPTDYLGSAGAFTDRALATHRAAGSAGSNEHIPRATDSAAEADTERS
ncbi:3-carboxy-cis,cis-muconate cycloisomerase [Lipingzhangella sp. LS1_29]|uniref:3-carboxy-cis,cis-muconate cycloisomerase n=1 Tax=Lipingzhangella rawalii TaxID=2055835 RepID=A0ABU2H7F3_9ACTN|nr:3-carboxy-cis,cis-muconate cycloisomerase [Lipingzhangella rawalii]MDS1271241.1 3-carboxy-cis,cis-muconate cycloisomerase [Lipingzhangella rawalii]